MTVFGGLGANDMPLRLLGDGGAVNFDWTYHLNRADIEKGEDDALHHYFVSITDEIAKFEYVIRREAKEIAPPNAAEGLDN